MLKAEVQPYHGYPALFVEGQPIAPMAITTMSKDETYLRSLGAAGIRIFFVICDTPWLVPDGLERLRRQTEPLLAAVPDAFIILRVGLHPPNEWLAANPEELVTFSDGKTRPVDLLSESYKSKLPGMYSLSSAKWREDGGKALRSFIAAVDAMPCGERVIGYFLAAGGTSEWYYPQSSVDLHGNVYADLSPAFRQQFRKTLQEKYGDVATLRTAWQDPEANFDNPTIPGLSQRTYSWSDTYEPRAVAGEYHHGSFLDLDKAQSASDFYQAWHHGTAETIIHFARIAKEATNNNRVVGAFYGSFGCTHYLEAGTLGGTLRVLDSGLVDFLAAPGNYENRKPGGYTAQREMQDSFRLRNQMFIVEEDTRTYRASKLNRDFTGTHTLRDTLTNMKRDFGRDICEDLQAWWFDMDPQGGWYDDPEILALIKRQQELARFSYAGDRTKKNEIAFIYDLESTGVVGQQTSRELCHMFRLFEMHRIGAPVDTYFHDDLANPLMPDYRLYVFANVFSLTHAEREAINAKVRRNGQVALWLYAPGYVAPDCRPRLSPANMSDLLGMEMTESATACNPRFRLTKAGRDLFPGADPNHEYGNFDRLVISGGVASVPPGPVTSSWLYPMFSPVSSDVTVLGSYVENGCTALAMKAFTHWTSVYCGTKTLRADLLRGIASLAGCHIWLEDDDCLYANQRFVVIHAKDSGIKRLRFPRACDPYEVYERRSYGKGVKELEVTMEAGDTLMFHLDGAC